jgi:ATP-dependent DNA helicase RecG
MLQALLDAMIEVPTKTSVKTSGKILTLIRENALVTIPVGVSERSIERNLKTLQAEHCLLRIGPANGGHWKVSE